MLSQCSYLLYFGDIPNLVSCAFSTIPIFPPFDSQNFLFTCLCPFFTCFTVLEESIQAGALLRPKNGYLVWSRGASSARARRAPGRPWRIMLQNAPIMLCRNSLKIPLLCLSLVLFCSHSFCLCSHYSHSHTVRMSVQSVNHMLVA